MNINKLLGQASRKGCCLALDVDMHATAVSRRKPYLVACVDSKGPDRREVDGVVVNVHRRGHGLGSIKAFVRDCAELCRRNNVPRRPPVRQTGRVSNRFVLGRGVAGL